MFQTAEAQRSIQGNNIQLRGAQQPLYYYSIKLMYSCKDYKYHEIIYTYMRHQEVYNNVNYHNTLKYILVKWTSFCTDLVGVGFCQGQIVLPHGVSLHLDHSVVGQETITDVLRQSLVHSRQVQGIGGGGLQGFLRGQRVKGRSNLIQTPTNDASYLFLKPFKKKKRKTLLHFCFYDSPIFP